MALSPPFLRIPKNHEPIGLGSLPFVVINENLVPEVGLELQVRLQKIIIKLLLLKGFSFERNAKRLLKVLT